MTKFNTHGGYFSPTGYFRVNVGGSHEENPNGGVQVGVDQQGIPNMLEEGEPVYDDYVYSDNITADEGLLEKHNIPKKFAGKLYSQIADAFVDEAEERPNDPISNNGLNAMLVRLADAQEEQKQIQEQKELEEELSNMSPEELEELEAMLTQQEEPVVEEPVAQEVPVMACGGKLRKYALGGDGELENDPAAQAAAIAELLQKNKEQRLLQESIDAARSKYERDSTAAAQRYNWAKWRYDRTTNRVNNMMDNAVNVSYDTDNYLGRLKKELEYQEQRKRDLDKAAAVYDTYLMGPFPSYGMPSATETVEYSEPDTTATAQTQDTANTVNVPVAEKKQVQAVPVSGNQIEIDWACGGKMNRYADGGWADFLKALAEYSVSNNPGGISGTYKIDTQFPLTGYDNIKALEDSDHYKRFTDYILANSGNENVRNYLRALDNGTPKTVAKLFDPTTGELVKDWESIYSNRRYDQKGGIYHFTPDSLDAVNSIIASGREQLPQVSAPTQDTMNFTLDKGIITDDWEPDKSTLIRDPEREAALKAQAAALANAEPTTAVTATSGTAGYPTIGRYTGAAYNLLNGLYNVFQEPDRYDWGFVKPTFVNGRLALQRQQYNPIDMQTAVNQWQANQNAGYRAINNSGYGASLPAVQLAAMYQGNQGYGNAITAARQYNDQHKASVIAQNNNAENAEANFYNRINAMNANIANQNAMYNHRIAMQQDLYNKQAENAKYEAIARALDAAAIDLSNIGRENFAMNQVNSNRANLGYGIDLNGLIRYLASLNK